MRSVWNYLNRPILGTKIIPPNARVDPLLFSDDEFPVYCPKCEYSLRGLSDPRCPECGEPFDRGRLLVIQYVEYRSKRNSRTLLRLSVSSFLLIGLIGGGINIYIQHLSSSLANNPIAFSAAFHRVNRVGAGLLVLQLIALIFLLSLMALPLIARHKDRKKRRQVIEQIKEAP